MKFCKNCSESFPLDGDHWRREKYQTLGGERVLLRCKIKRLSQEKKFREQNPDKIKANNTKWYAKNAEVARDHNKAKYIANREVIKARVAAYRKRHPEKAKRAVREAIAKSPEQYKKRNAERAIHLRVFDPNYRLGLILRSSVQKALKNQTNHQESRTVEHLGCSIDDLRNHLEAQFQPGMSWDNYGEWVVDHITPLRCFDLSSPEDLAKAGHYTNLQPLWAADNLTKRSQDMQLPAYYSKFIK